MGGGGWCEDSDGGRGGGGGWIGRYRVVMVVLVVVGGGCGLVLLFCNGLQQTTVVGSSHFGSSYICSGVLARCGACNKAELIMTFIIGSMKEHCNPQPSLLNLG